MMKYLFLLLFLFYMVILSQDQTSKSNENIILTFDEEKTNVTVNEKGELIVNVSLNDIARFKANGFVRYSDFGAVGDGKTDDINNISATHEFANQHDLTVKSDMGATYYIGGRERKAVIKTNTDFGTAAFIIDDTEVQNNRVPIFEVSSDLKSFKLDGITSLKRDQKKIDVILPGPCLITVTDSNTKRYIRFGPNQNKGSSQTDIFLVDKNGNVDMKAPIIWDFDQITEISALPVNETTLKITGGQFRTIANKAESKYNYYWRNINIIRSNVVVDGLEHRIIGEEDHGAPYRGFISIKNCSGVTVKNTILTGHKTYITIGSAGRPVSMGSYDISVNRALNISFINCSQTNDINDKTYWGIMASNYSKNLLYDNCKLSRFDAHMGVANATIRNSSLGYMGIRLIGSGNFSIENSSVHSWNFISLREDYGSTWNGKFHISNCTFVPLGDENTTNISLIGGFNSGQHDFGYTCYMPEEIIIEKFHIDDKGFGKTYLGPTIFNNFNPKMLDKTYKEKFPYVRTKNVILKNVTTASGKTIRISDNPFMFENVKIMND